LCRDHPVDLAPLGQQLVPLVGLVLPQVLIPLAPCLNQRVAVLIASESLPAPAQRERREAPVGAPASPLPPGVAQPLGQGVRVLRVHPSGESGAELFQAALWRQIVAIPVATDAIALRHGRNPPCRQRDLATLAILAAPV